MFRCLSTRWTCAGCPAAEQQQRVKAITGSGRGLGFDLSKPPLMRLMLIRLAEGLSQFVWSHHHILLDGWSMSLLLTEVFQMYEAFRRHRPAQVLPVRPYRDYIAWLGRQDAGRAERFWVDWLKGFTSPTPLPFSRVQDLSTGETKTQLKALSASLVERLRSLAPATAFNAEYGDSNGVGSIACPATAESGT